MTVIEFRSIRRAPVLPPSRLHMSEPTADAYMPRWWRDEAHRVESIGYTKPHAAATDYTLVKMLSLGRKLGGIAAVTGIGADALCRRWHVLTKTLRDEHGTMPVEAQGRLLQVLRHRAGVME